MFFKRRNKKENLSEEQKQWNLMWELWADGDICSPINELMTYQGEVNNGGHAQYFVNTENNGDLNAEILALNTILPSFLMENLKSAYFAHLKLEQDETDTASEEVLKKCDEIFFENEELINDILKKHSMEI